MSKPFVETTRALKADHFRASMIALILVVILLGVWLWWFLFGRIAAWEVSHLATLEVANRAFAVDAALAGKVAEPPPEVGERVVAGSQLLRLDAEIPVSALRAADQRLVNLEAEMVALAGQAEANRAALMRSLAEKQSLIQEVAVQLKDADAQVAINEDIVGRYTELTDQKLMSDLDLLKAKSTLENARAVKAQLAHRLDLYRNEEQTTTLELKRLQAEIEIERTKLLGSIEGVKQDISQLRETIDRHIIRAPESGTLGEVATLQEGSFVSAGYGIATIIPEGKPHIVARFTPALALGRIKVGQGARLRLEGFPWTQYGSIEARVTSVRQQPRDGYIQVHLALDGPTPERIPIQHGMPGTVEVHTGDYAPAVLMLRALGKVVGGSGSEGASE